MHVVRNPLYFSFCVTNSHDHSPQKCPISKHHMFLFSLEKSIRMCNPIIQKLNRKGQWQNKLYKICTNMIMRNQSTQQSDNDKSDFKSHLTKDNDKSNFKSYKWKENKKSSSKTYIWKDTSKSHIYICGQWQSKLQVIISMSQQWKSNFKSVHGVIHHVRYARLHTCHIYQRYLPGHGSVCVERYDQRRVVLAQIAHHTLACSLRLSCITANHE